MLLRGTSAGTFYIMVELTCPGGPIPVFTPYSMLHVLYFSDISPHLSHVAVTLRRSATKGPTATVESETGNT